MRADHKAPTSLSRPGNAPIFASTHARTMETRVYTPNTPSPPQPPRPTSRPTIPTSTRCIASSTSNPPPESLWHESCAERNRTGCRESVRCGGVSILRST